MPRGGRAWRGFFPAGGELTSGRPDWKEGLYLGSELGADCWAVTQGVRDGVPRAKAYDTDPKRAESVLLF